MIPKNEWKWHGHAGHFIGGTRCQFHLLTSIGPWQVSTVGEYVPFGQTESQELGYNRTFETMVFRIYPLDAGNPVCGCPCVANWSVLDMNGYNDPKAATEGHYAMCEKWAAISLEEWVKNNEVTNE